VRCAMSIRHTMSGRFSLRRVGAEGTVTILKNDSRLNAAHDGDTMSDGNLTCRSYCTITARRIFTAQFTAQCVTDVG
jgi:hypothetical protein